MSEPQPCGRIASVTHCCEYHGIHSDDDVLARIADLESQLRARDAQVLEDGRTIINQRIKLDSAKQILDRLRGHAVPVELARRIDHWLASAMPSDYERVSNHLIRHLVIAAVGWSSGDGTLEDLQQAAHQLRAAGEL